MYRGEGEISEETSHEAECPLTGARWKHNVQALKTEGCKRNKVISLLDTLTKKPHWKSDLAFRFLHEKYPNETKTGRALSNYLNKKTTLEIIELSSLYP